MKKYYIGVDLGGTNIAIAVTDEDYNILVKSSVPTLAERGGDAIATDMAALAKKLCESQGIKITDVSGVGIASPGTVNPETGIIEYANNIRFRDFPMAQRFSEETGIPVEKIALGNDANLAALGEYVAGTGRGTKSLVMITLGTGVGGGVIIDGKVLTGFKFGGAELGHMTIVYNGRKCTCGRRGCFEAYCSATALVKLTKEKFIYERDTMMHDMCGGDIEKVGGKTAFAAARMGDLVGREVVSEYINYLACGIANLINIFQPEILLIGGGVCNEGKNLLDPLFSKLDHEIYGTMYTKVAIASLGNDAGMIGAAAAAMQKTAAKQ